MSKLSIHNKEVRYKAEYRASEMTMFPSPLEEMMKSFLDEHNIRYDFQRIFYIFADDGWIVRYYIADFYIPDKCIIIEVDGKFHDKHKQHDKERTKEIQRNYPGIEVLRYKWQDMSNKKKMQELLNIIR